MAAAAPAQLSGLANLLLRRPPSLRDLVTLVGYADDYAWFVGLVRRLFPKEAEAALAAPTYAGGWSASPISSGSGTSPSTRRSSSSGRRRRGNSLLVMAEAGHPLRPDGLRLRRPPRDVGRLPRGALGHGPAGQALRRLLRRTRRAAGGLAGVSRRAHPAGDPAANPKGRHTPGRPHRGAEGNEVRGAAQACSWVLAETGNFFLDHTYETGRTTASPTPGRTTSSRRDGGVAQGQRPHGLGQPVDRLAGGDLPGRFAEMLDFVLERIPEQDKEGNDDEQ